MGSSHLLFPASPLRPGPRSRPDLPAATPCSSNTVQKGLNAGEQQLHAVNPGFSAPISVPVICISLLCASFSSSPSVARAPAFAYGARRGLQGSRCAPACAICRRHQFFSTFLISHYSQAHAALHSTLSSAVLTASWRDRGCHIPPRPFLARPLLLRLSP